MHTDLLMNNYNGYFLLPFNRKLGFIICAIFLLSSCSKTNYSYQPAYQFKSVDKKPDYNDLNYWAAHPWKKDPSDSIPRPLKTLLARDSGVDVFFLHPTTFTDPNDTRWNADIDDPELNAKTDYSSILYQASAFNENCRVFAPRYRQAHIKAFFVSDSVSAPYFEIAYDDIRAAFTYYLKYLNNGRPIIIAAHSQGTKHAGRLLQEFFDNKPLEDKLICAYLVGMPAPDNYFSALQPCKDSLSTGCFVSWRTFKKGYDGGEIIREEKFKAVVINPLSWTNDTTFIPPSYNLGGVLQNFNVLVPGVVGAEVHKNVLWTGKPDMPGKILLTMKNYHVGDINLFYTNIRVNVAARIRAYLKKNQ